MLIRFVSVSALRSLPLLAITPNRYCFKSAAVVVLVSIVYGFVLNCIGISVSIYLFGIEELRGGGERR